MAMLKLCSPELDESMDAILRRLSGWKSSREPRRQTDCAGGDTGFGPYAPGAGRKRRGASSLRRMKLSLSQNGKKPGPGS